MKRMGWLLPVVLGAVWVPALYVAWRICPALLRMYQEFEMDAGPLTHLLLPRMGWLTPALMLLTIALATWLRHPVVTWLCLAIAISTAAAPIALWLVQIQSLRGETLGMHLP